MKQDFFNIVNGRWVIGNLYDKLIACKFDLFINLQRSIDVSIPVRVKKDLSIHNYKFNYDKR